MRVAISFCQHCSCAGCLRVSLLWGWGWRCCSGCVGVVKTVVKGDSSQNRFKLVYHRKINIGSLGVSQRGLRLYGACLTKISNYFSSSLSLPLSACLSLSPSAWFWLSAAGNVPQEKVFQCVSLHLPPTRHVACNSCAQLLAAVCVCVCVCVSLPPSSSLANCRH